MDSREGLRQRGSTKYAAAAPALPAAKGYKPQQQSAPRRGLPLLLQLVAGLLLMVLVTFLTVCTIAYVRFSGGSPFPNLIEGLQPINPTGLETVATLPIPSGNIAVSARGRIFFNFHPQYRDDGHGVKIAEWLPKEQKYRAFPSLPYQANISTVLSLRIDSKNRLWLLDYESFGFSGRPSLTAFQLDGSGEEKVILKYIFPKDVAGMGSMLNDFAISPDARFIYIADTSIVLNAPGLIVFDVERQKSWVRLPTHPSMRFENFYHLVEGSPLYLGSLLPLKINVDSIALDRKGEYLYYGAVTGTSLYRISTEFLNDEHKEEKDISAAVELVSKKTASDGITIDDEGNIYLTDFEHSAVTVIDGRTKQLKLLTVDKERLKWPDGCR